MKNNSSTPIDLRASYLAKLFILEKITTTISKLTLTVIILAFQLMSMNIASAADMDNSNQTPSDTNEPYPLLGSSHAESFMSTFCEGQPDSTEVPLDPRELIQPGVNAGRAVAFNAYWESCTAVSGNPNTKSKTCGEYRERRIKGEQLMRQGLAMSALPVFLYNQLWKDWGVDERPDDFDAQVRERYGLPEANFHNPYPLPGEDPNKTDGGSGQLPAGLVLSRKPDGSYSRLLGMTCDFCHAGEIKALGETPQESFVSGMGNHDLDGQLLVGDLLFPYIPAALSSSRGVTNAMGLSGLIVSVVDYDSSAFYPVASIAKMLFMQIPGNTSGAGDTKMPAWWNASHRPRKFWDAGFSYDAMRMDNVILQVDKPLLNPGETGGKLLRNLERHAADTQAYIESLTSPEYPGDIDTNLAKQGAILFHAKDLWAEGANAGIPKPPTNGSCAGCHGVYSPYFANDDRYLEDPRLMGIAGYISPLEEIGTDPARLEGFTPRLLEILSTSWLSYPEGAEGYVPPEEKEQSDEIDDDYLALFSPGTRPRGACHWQGTNPEDVKGYLAPPLYGIWATAPYLHNGSVPDVWSLLDPSQRPNKWRRQLNQGEGTEHGFATEFVAYDQQKMGWKYDAICEDCEEESLFNRIIRWTGGLASLGYQSLPVTDREGAERRKIFDTKMFAKGNQGHDFGQALNDAERRAVIEYLKTL